MVEVFSPIRRLLLQSPPPPAAAVLLAVVLVVCSVEVVDFSATLLLPRPVVRSLVDLRSAVVVVALEGCSPPPALVAVVVVVDCLARLRPRLLQQVDSVARRVSELPQCLGEAHLEEWLELAILQLVPLLALVAELAAFLLLWEAPRVGLVSEASQTLQLKHRPLPSLVRVPRSLNVGREEIFATGSTNNNINA